MHLADIPSRSARFGSNARGPKSQSRAQSSSAFEAIAGFQAMHALPVPPVEIALATHRIRDGIHATKPRVACPPRRPSGEVTEREYSEELTPTCPSNAA
jgi:hypothetical protein